MRSNAYRQEIRALLSPGERRVLQKLSTPEKIQNYLDHLPVNFELTGETLMSPRRTLAERKAHCLEAALLAATSLAYHGQPPLLLDLQSLPRDHDHVVALFKYGKYWGAISKINHPVLRWRDPVYKSVRELAMSYFNEYFLPDGRKSMLAYSKPFDLRRYKPERWVTAQEDLYWLGAALDDSPHSPAVSSGMRRSLRRASPLERKASNLEGTQAPQPKNRGRKGS